jgi:diadenosine tetraphosphatase ApaH/serine/threonine PP2A family protein phosphatase
MRYAIFTDIHANLEALEAVLAKMDQLAQDDPIDQIWFLGDLVGYGPNPNECIDKLRERTDVLIAGNHDWAAVGKIDLEDFSEAARISAEWTAQQLTEEHRTFLANLPQRLERDDCTLVHGSPYGPLWEYLTSEVLAERSFEHFSTRFCIVGHTHVPVIFQQPDVIANSPTAPLELDLPDEIEDEALSPVTEQVTNEDIPEDLSVTEVEAEVEERIEDEVEEVVEEEAVEEVEEETVEEVEEEIEEKAVEKQEQATENDVEEETQDDKIEVEETQKTPVVQYASRIAAQSDRVYTEIGSLEEVVAEAADVVAEVQYQMADDIPNPEIAATTDTETTPNNGELTEQVEQDIVPVSDETHADQEEISIEVITPEVITPEATIQNAEERLNAEIEELLNLLGLSQSMINITNEMIIPPEGNWQAPKGYRAIINPGGVGQPRDGDPRAAFMIYDTERGFTFYRVAYPLEKTQEKIRQAQLPQHLATRLAYGR